MFSNEHTASEGFQPQPSWHLGLKCAVFSTAEPFMHYQSTLEHSWSPATKTNSTLPLNRRYLHMYPTGQNWLLFFHTLWVTWCHLGKKIKGRTRYITIQVPGCDSSSGFVPELSLEYLYLRPCPNLKWGHAALFFPVPLLQDNLSEWFFLCAPVERDAWGGEVQLRWIHSESQPGSSRYTAFCNSLSRI